MLNAHLLFIFGFSLCSVGHPTCWSYLPSQGKRISGLADSAGGKLPTTTRTGRFPAWSSACKRWEEPVRLMKDTFPLPHNIPCLPWEWAGTTQPPLGQHSWANLSSHIPNGSGSPARCPWPQVGNSGRSNLPTHLPAVGNGAYSPPRSACKARQTAVIWSSPADLAPMRIWSSHMARALEKRLKICSQLFPRGCLLPPSWQAWLTVQTLLAPLRTKSNKQTFSGHLNLRDFALRHIKSDYMAGNCRLAGSWWQRAGSSKTSRSYLFSYGNNRGTNVSWFQLG